MPKYIVLFIILFSIQACKHAQSNEEIFRVALLRGPSALAFAQWMENPPEINGRKVEIRIVDTPEVMQAILVKEEAELAVLPMINAANLYNKGINYPLIGCPVWGTLYVVERKDIAPENSTLYLFGAGTTPDILTRYYLKTQGQTYNLNYSFSSAREILQGIVTNRIDRAVISEPFLSIALSKDSTLQITADLNHLPDNKSGYPQTAIVYHSSLQKELSVVNDLLQESADFTVRHPEKAIRIVESYELFPSEALTPESIARCKINYRPAETVKENIFAFLKLIEQYESKAIGNRLPDENFIYVSE